MRAVNTVIATLSLADLKIYLRWHAVHGAAARLPAGFSDATVVRKQPAGGRTVEGGDQFARRESVPCERRGLQHAGIPEGVFVQG
jgi:hypothetical protein